MKSRLPKYLKLDTYSDGPEYIVKNILGCRLDNISRDVVVAPNWSIRIFHDIADNIIPILDHKIYEVSYKGNTVTFIRSGIGAPQTGDVILSLGCTNCQRIIVTGSCGALNSTMMIGDVLIVAKAFSGEGFSRYLDTALHPRDNFFRDFSAHTVMSQKLYGIAQSLCAEHCHLHLGNVFTADSLLAQFMRLDHLVDHLNCIGIEMEMSAAIAAADIIGIHISALLQVSDVIPTGKSLLNERPTHELEKRAWIKEHLLGKIILESLRKVDDASQAL